MGTVERIWIESTVEQEAICVLGALGDYGAHLRFIDGAYQVEVKVDPDDGEELMRAIHRAVRNCLDDDGLDSVVFHAGEEAYSLRQPA